MEEGKRDHQQQQQGYGRRASSHASSSLGSAGVDDGSAAAASPHQHHHRRRRSGGSNGSGGDGPPASSPTSGVMRAVSQSFQLSFELVKALSVTEGLSFCQICRGYEPASETFRLADCGHCFCRGMGVVGAYGVAVGGVTVGARLPLTLDLYSSHDTPPHGTKQTAWPAT